MDFHHWAALGLNKAIVCPGPEGAQKSSGSGCWGGQTQVATLSRVLVTDLVVAQFLAEWRLVGGRATHAAEKNTDRVRVQERDYLPGRK